MESLAVRLRGPLLEYLPAVTAGVLSAAAFVTLGHTPLVRALGLAASVAAVTLTLQRFGRVLAVIGGLALAFSPAFWAQAGGGEQPLLTLILAILALTIGVTGLLLLVSRRPTFGLAAGVVIFVLLFWGLTGTPRSLRLTTLLAAGSLYLLVDGLMIAHPRAEAAETGKLGPRHSIGLLLLLALGVLNDPLFILLAPAIALGLLLLKQKLPWWTWAALALVALVGVRGMIVQYVDADWWLFPARQAVVQGIRVPFLLSDGWREGSRWLYLIEIIVGQFGAAGAALGVVGLARLSRWHPAVGEVTMLAYASYALFGLAYFGANSSVLLLPLLMIQVMWMTYAVGAFGQWLQNSMGRSWGHVRWVAPAAFMLIPLLMLVRIARG